MKVLVVGGGIAGVETALTLAVGHDDVDVTLIHESPFLRLVPNLVYAPFGVPTAKLELPLVDALHERNIATVCGTVERINDAEHTIIVDGTAISYDVLVLATGTETGSCAARTLRSLDDALLLRDDLAAIEAAGAGKVTILQLPENAWPAPGYELAMLLGTWREAYNMPDLQISVVTSARVPFGLFGLAAADASANRMAELGIQLVGGVPASRIEQLSQGLTIDMVNFAARRIAGAPPVGTDGFYRAAANGMIGPDMFVAGDAAEFPIKAAFATSWQARRILLALGGSLEQLGTIDGVPATHSEYQMDLGNATLAVRIPCRDQFAGTWMQMLAHQATVIMPQVPDKLRGTMIRHCLMARTDPDDAAHTFQQIIQPPDLKQAPIGA